MNVKFPEICVNCQGQPDTTFHVDYGSLDTGKKVTKMVWSDWISVKFGHPEQVSVTEDGSFEMPICSRCKNKHTSRVTIFVISFIVMLFSGLLILGILFGGDLELFNINKNMIIYLIIPFIIGIFGIILASYKIKTGGIYFIDCKNVEITDPQYAKKFAELNPQLNVSIRGSVKKHES
jgi:hypothetical protein